VSISTRNAARKVRSPVPPNRRHGGDDKARGEAGPGLYAREDWTLFRSVPTISQKAGVAPERLRRLVAKELTDNALDACGSCDVGELDDGRGFYVEDQGPGIAGEPEEVAWLFSVRRPLASSKIHRLPTRGALGNGLRVVAAAVLASGGGIDVYTRGRHLRLTPDDSGVTAVVAKPCRRKVGARVEVRLGDAIPHDPLFLSWAEWARAAAGRKPIYTRRSSPYWHDSDSFFELLQASGDRTVRDVVGGFEGCSARASEIAGVFLGRPAVSLDRDEAQELLASARSHCDPVKPQRLQLLKHALGGHHAKSYGTLTMNVVRGKLAAELPYTVEAWCSPLEAGDGDEAVVLVNRTPVTGNVDLTRESEKTHVALFGCNLGHKFRVGRKPVSVTINVQTPHMPITSDGKAPNLRLYVEAIADVIESAARKCQRANPSAKGRPQARAILDHLEEDLVKAGGGKSRFSQRRLFYVVRPRLLDEFRKEPSWNWFCKVITAHESERGADIEGMYRDNRGSLYHPHLRVEIPLGTLSVERYERPRWTFNKILYSEKEGLFGILRAEQWPELNDCALLTSKGYATKAARDVLDLLGETDEDLDFFCIHDADAYGTRIYQALQEGTVARPGRRVRVINLGLEPWQAREMGLEVERFPRAKKRRPVGDYVGAEWTEWLQTNRVELDSMSTAAFVEWLDRAIAEHGNGKVMPPTAAMAEHLAATARQVLEGRVRERILAQAGFEAQVAAAMSALHGQLEACVPGIQNLVSTALEANHAELWRQPVERLAEELVRKGAW
jgi:hypothetical protein